MPVEFTGTDKYYLNPELREIINIAIAMEKPILVTGEAGTGKTRLAYEAARGLGLKLEVAHCKSTMKGEELCYVYDTVLRLNDSRFGSGNTGRNVDNIWDYIVWGPIGRAFAADQKVVLLLDEIDKTESDVQDNLLDVLDECQFTVREANHVVEAKHRPITVITSNAKRELSDPFLRRCYCHYIPFPDPEEMKEIVRLHYPDIDKTLLNLALNIFYELRKQKYEKPPSTGELIDWLGALQRSNRIPKDMTKVPYVSVLLKRTGDILKYKEEFTNEKKFRF